MVWRNFAAIAVMLWGNAAALAQSTAQQPLAPLLNVNAHYTSVTARIEVNQPIDRLWDRIGSFCDFGNWVNEPCEIVAGQDREVGAVRIVNHRYVEVIVATTLHSYTYAFPPRQNAYYTMLHGTVEARAISPGQTEVIYTQLWDNAPIEDANERLKENESRKARLLQELAAMKNLNGSPDPGK